MTEKWNNTTLGNVCKFSGGSGFPKQYQGSKIGEYLFVKVSDMNLQKNWKHIEDANNRIDEAIRSQIKAKIVPQGSVVFAKIGEALKSERLRVVSKPTVIDNNMMAATPISDAIDPAYLYYLLSTVGLASWAGGSALPYLTQGDLEKIEVCIPPLSEQRTIATSLAALDELIETNRRLALDELELARILVNDAIANATEVHPLVDLADFINGKNFTSGATGSGLPVIRTPEVRMGPTATTVLSDVIAADNNVAESGDILFVWSGSLMVERWRWGRGLVNQHVFKVMPKDDYPDWLVFFLIEKQMEWFLALAADKATTMGHIKREHLREAVRVPSRDEILRLTKVIEPLWRDSLEKLRENDELAPARDLLIPLLISGKITPNSAAKLLEGVTH